MSHDSSPLKILLFGDASNYHNTLAGALRRLGHDVTVASDGTQWMDTARDIDLSRRRGKIAGLKLWYRMRFGLADRLSGYDIVSIAGTHFARLRPGPLTSIFNFIRRNNRHVYQTALATDTFFIDECLSPDSALRYNEWRVNGRPTAYADRKSAIASEWQAPALSNYCHHLSANVDGAVTALYEYHISCQRAYPHDRIAYGGIPVDTDTITFNPPSPRPGEKVKLFLGYPSARMLEKGSERLLAAARQVAADYPDRCELDVASDIPLVDFMERLGRSHVVIDQLYSYTPATTALMAMAMGRTVISGAEPEFYDFIGEHRLHPIVNVRPYDDREIYNTIKETVLHPEMMPARGTDGRRFVEKHNAATVVAQRFIDFWRYTSMQEYTKHVN